MHDLDLQQLAEAAMLQQAHEGDAHSHSDAVQARSNPRRSVNAAGSGTAGTSVNRATEEDDNAGPARRTRQRSTRNTAASAASTLPSTTSSSASLASSSFARSPTGTSNGNNGNGKTSSITTGGISAGDSDLSSTIHPENSLRVAAPSRSSLSSARQLGTSSSSTSAAATPQPQPLPALSPAKPTKRKDRRNAAQKASISSINTVKSSLSATSAATSTPSLSHTATDPSISSAASDISSRTSEDTYATTPEHASSSLEAVHVLYAKGAQHPSYSNASISIPPAHPYPVYHQQNFPAIAEGKLGPAYHHSHSPQLRAQAISAGSGRYQAQHAYVNVQGRQFDPSQVQLYPHDGQDESSQGQQADSSLSNNEVNGGVRYFIDPYALPSDHPYHPSQIHSTQSTPQPHQQHGGLSYASTASAPSLQNDSSLQQQHYATSALPPLPGSEYLLQFSNAPQPHLQSSSGSYHASGSGNGLHEGTGLDASTLAAANASTSTNTSVGDTVNDDSSMMSNNNKTEDEAEGEGNQEGEDGNTSTQPRLPTKKQKGRRPTNTNLESKNHKCKFSNCNWSFSRREHLRRHEKTHTQEKPFLCDIPLCGLRFSRLDNLNSHKRTHDKGKRTSQWHVAKVVGAQQASRAGSGSVMDGSEDGRASAEASTSALQPAQSAGQSGNDDSLLPHSAGGNGGSGQQNRYAMPGSSTLQRNGFPTLPSMDNNMISGNTGSTVGAEVRFAYYDPSEQQAPHSSGGHQHPQHSMAGLGGPYGNVRGYQDPFSYSAPPPPPHGVPIHSSAIAHSHLPPHPVQHQQMQQQHQMQHQQHAYNHQPLPPLPPHMHDESAYIHQQRSHQQQQQHLSPHLQAGGMALQHEYDVYNADQHRHQIPQHHLMQHHEHQGQQQQQQGVPPPPPTAAASNRNVNNNKRRRNEIHRSNNSMSTSNDNSNGTAMNTPVIPQPGNQMESPSHKRRQSGRKGGINA